MKFNLKQFLKKGQPAYRKHEQIVERDWRLLVIVFLALNSAIIMGSLYLFWVSNSALGSSGGEVQKKTEKFRQQDVDILVEKYTLKQEEFFKVQASKATATDPSL